MTPCITLITLGVSDVAGARNFYERLGLKASSAGNDEVAFFNVNGLVLALWGRKALAEDAGLKSPPPGQFSGTALAWNTSSQAEADAVLAHAVACGAKLTKPARKTFWGGYSGYFADPDGYLWEVAHNPFWPFDGAGRVVLP
jgi:catechol 2,3-dioxygenase-like lactoylglutathione lyase family enzyme